MAALSPSSAPCSDVYPARTRIAALFNRLREKQLPVDYWDVRVEDVQEARVNIQNGELESVEETPSVGAFVRVFHRGKWLYESTTEVDRLDEALEALSRRAQSLRSEISDELKKRFLGQAKAFDGSKLRFAEDSLRAVPLERKVEFLRSVEPAMRAIPEIRNSLASYSDLSKYKAFVSSQGARYEFDYQHCGIGLRYTMKRGERSFADTVQRFAHAFEDLRSATPAKLEAEMRGSLPFLDAPTIDPGLYRVVLDSEVVGVFAHESFGHKSEADFMLGDDHALAEWRFGAKVGSDNLSIFDDGTFETGSGYLPWDDEGIPTKKTYLIRDGVLVGRLHSRTTAMEFDEDATGNGRAMNFQYEPMVRMRTTCVEAGLASFDEMLQKTGYGLYVQTYQHGSGLSTFTIAPLRAYRIENGKIGKPVRVNVLSGNVFETLKKIEACSSEFRAKSSAFGGCGKGEQWPLPVGMGGPQVLIRDMQAN